MVFTYRMWLSLNFRTNDQEGQLRVAAVMTAVGVAAVIRQNLSFGDVRKTACGLVVNVLVEGEHQRRERR